MSMPYSIVFGVIIYSEGLVKFIGEILYRCLQRPTLLWQARTSLIKIATIIVECVHEEKFQKHVQRQKVMGLRKLAELGRKST